MTVMFKATGERTTAQYITTQTGNKRYNVNGKTYSDRQFDKTFAIVPDSGPMIWKSHVRQLFTEILDSNDTTWILSQPLRITLHILGAAAQHAAKIQDDKMIGFFCSLALYTFSDPTDPDFDQERTNYYLNKITS
jgi:hypothetical protein